MHDRGREQDHRRRPGPLRWRAVERGALRALLRSAVASLSLLAGAVPAAAGTAAAPDAAPRQEANLTLDRAVEMVQRRFAARVVRAEETREGEEVVYRIRLLSADGRVFTVRVYARSGRVD